MVPDREQSRTSGARPFGEDYTTPERDCAQERDDTRAVQRQRAALAPSRERDAFRRRLLRRLQARRADRPDLLQFDVVRDGRVDIAVVRGSLVVRQEMTDDAGAMAMLERAGIRAEPVECLDGRLLTLTDRGASASSLLDLARVLRARGHPASLETVPPLGPFTKGQVGAEHTTLALPLAKAAAWQREVVVAVVDTGISAAKRDDGWLAGLDTGGDEVDPLDDIPNADGLLDFGAGHGTFVAGVVQRVAPQATLRIHRAMDSDGIGSEVDVACAIVTAARKGAHVVNLSLGGHTVDDQPLLAVQVAMEILAEEAPETLVIAAAGNEGTSRPVFPAAQHGVVSVAGLDADLRRTAWSSRGWWVDCSTVGEGLVAPYVVGRESPDLDPEPETWDGPSPWALWTGTSFAAPQVAGAVARLCGEGRARTPQDALQLLLAQGRHVPDHGRAVHVLPGTH